MERTTKEDEILIIEDDPDIASLIARELHKFHYSVRIATDSQKGLAKARQQPPELIILDLMLPELDGWQVCRLIKTDPKTKAIPILILTALGEEADRVRGLELGADDYLLKPFSLKELIARVRALLRRAHMPMENRDEAYLQVGQLTIDVECHEIRLAGRRLTLTPTEFALLKYLAQHPGKVFTRDQLITALWGEDRFVEEHNLDVHIHSLRQHLESDPAHPRYLLTLRGVGY
ncbi:MAG TPA: response regulator transcription factor, partial [Nitrospiria bacterium]|nr:response regulator transcription factor [Nitrospiria bacterium]